MIKADVNDPIFLAWAAGFFDGEGCVFVSRSRNRDCQDGYNRLLTATVCQQDVFPLELLQEAFGGKLYRDTKAASGNRVRKNVIYRWRLHSDGALKFLASIRPYATVKASQIDIALGWPPERRSGVGARLADEVHLARETIWFALREAKAAIKEEVI